MDRVAVLMACYEGERWVEEQIESILNQENVEVEIFISIDLSNDNTASICHKLSKNNSNIHILSHQKRFGSASNNFYHLIESCQVKGVDYIAFSDQDDIWKLDKLQRAIMGLKCNNAQGYSSNVTAFWPSKPLKLIDKSGPQKRFDYLFEAAGPGCTYVLTQQLFESIRNAVIKFNMAKTAIMHDWFIYAYSRASSQKWYIDSYSSTLYRQHSNNQLGANVSIQTFINRFKIVFSQAQIDNLKQLFCILASQEQSIEKWTTFSRSEAFSMMLQTFQFRRKKTEALVVALFLIFVLVVGRKKT